MKRIFFAIGALLSAILICTAGYLILVDTCDKLENTLDQIVVFAEKGDVEKIKDKKEAKKEESTKIEE